MANEIHEIPLEQIRPAPWNPPSRLDSEKVQNLAASIQRGE
jgi:ParB-like chromosome segregation protein Spo0J